MIAAHASSGTRAAIAALLVIVLVAAVQFVSIFRGSSLAFELSYIGIPTATALSLYRTWRARVVGWVLLTGLSLLTRAALVIGFLTQ